MSKWRLALTSLFVAHSKRLEALTFRRIGDWTIAEELVQDSFLRICSAGSSGSAEGDTKRLYAVARNAAIDHVRTKSRRNALLSSLVPEQVWPESPSLERQIEARESLTELDAALDELGDTTKQVFILRRYYGLSSAETAQDLGISISCVEKHLAQALRHCQKRLGGDNADSK